MVKNPLLEQLRSEISPEDKARIDESFAIANRIATLLKKHNISQKQLAERLNKRESEISKWLSGGHNFTIDTLTKIGLAVGERVYSIPGTTEFENSIKLSVFKSVVLQTFELHEYSSLIDFKKVRTSDNASTLHVTSTGVICNSVKEERKEAFKYARLKPAVFRRIDKIDIS